jgi:hypothetical protein
MKTKKINGFLLLVLLLAVAIIAMSIVSFVYSYLRSEKLAICENLSNSVQHQDRKMKINITKTGEGAQHLMISESLPNGTENIVVDLEGFSGDTIQIQSINMDIAELGLDQDCYIRDQQIPLFLRIFGPFLERGVLDVSPIGEVPSVYKSDGVCYLIQRNVWKKIWAYTLDPSNKKTINVYNVVLDIQDIDYKSVQEYTISLQQNGQISIKYPFTTNITPARGNE